MLFVKKDIFSSIKLNWYDKLNNLGQIMIFNLFIGSPSSRLVPSVSMPNDGPGIKHFESKERNDNCFSSVASLHFLNK